MENTLPGSQVLASGESVISKQGFISSMSTFYIKSDFAITNKRLIAHFPNIVLGCLPLGFGNITFNLKQISGVNIEVSYKIFKLLLGVLAIFIGLGSVVS